MANGGVAAEDIQLTKVNYTSASRDNFDGAAEKPAASVPTSGSASSQGPRVIILPESSSTPAATQVSSVASPTQEMPETQPIVAPPAREMPPAQPVEAPSAREMPPAQPVETPPVGEVPPSPTDKAKSARKQPAAAPDSEPRPPLAGVRVLDLTRLSSGPYATMLMAEMGADVIKIEDMINPDALRQFPPFVGQNSASFMALNRSKRAISLKLNEERGQEIFFRMVKNADIVVEQFRPGVLDKIGMGYFEAIKTNPRIIYISLTGYGQKGPYAKKTGNDINFMGLSGLLNMSSDARARLSMPGGQIADVAGGAYMAIIAALSALWAREQTGIGQKVDVSMLESILPMMTLPLTNLWAAKMPENYGNSPLSGAFASYGVYKCADDRYIALGILEPKYWERFCILVNKPEWVDLLLVPGEEQEKLKVKLKRLFGSKTRSQWMETVGNADCCLTPVLSIDEVERDEHLLNREAIIEHESAAGQKMKGIAMPLKYSGTPLKDVRRAPSLGENSLEILRELGYEDSEIRELLKKKIVFIPNAANSRSSH